MKLGQDIWALDSSKLPWRCKGYSHYPKKNNHENWRKVPTTVTFSMLEAASTCVWACDFEHQVYLFVKECDLPIRFQDYMFEYERWYPGKGWTRVTREAYVPKRKLSSHWSSDSVWRVDRNVEGQATDANGWQYATGYTSTYQPSNGTTTMVRRKRLARYFTYSKMGSFAMLTDAGSIKFLDVSAGGTMLPCSNNWPICVWGVSKDCKVYFRENICSINPEGDSWTEICQPDFFLGKINVGPRGQLWGITTHGELVTRSGISNDNLRGDEWLQIDLTVGRMPNIYPTALAVTSESVWLVDCKGRVFFHKGSEIFVRNTLLLTDKHDSSSTSKWLPMVMDPGNIITFKYLTCGPDNQVWGVDEKDCIYNRTDITLTQISGQSWQLIEDPQLKNSTLDDDSEDETDDSHASKYLNRGKGLVRTLSKGSTAGSMYSHVGNTLPYADIRILPEYTTCSSYEGEDLTEADELFNLSTDEDSDATRDQHNTVQHDKNGVHYWTSISAGGCLGVGISKDNIVSKQAELSKVQIANIKNCRASILDKLRELGMHWRSKQFDSYLVVFDTEGCKLKTTAKIELDGNWQSATVYLSNNIPHGHLRFRVYKEDSPDEDEGRSRGMIGQRARMGNLEPTVMINQTSTVEHVVQIPLITLYGIKRLSRNRKDMTLLLYTAERSYKLQFMRDTDCDNWFDRVNDYVRAVHEVPNVPPNQSVWSLTGYGTIYFSPPVPSCVTNHSNRAWLPIEGNFTQISAGPRSIVWAVSADSNLYCFTRGYGGGNHTMGENLEKMSVLRHFMVTENQRYRLLSGFRPCGHNDRISPFVDESNNAIKSINQFRLPLASWKWVGEWTVKSSDNCDDTGWSYARNFHSPFSACYTRGARKRNKIRAAVMSCNGPWKKIPIKLVKVLRVAVEHYCFKNEEDEVVAWALCSSGSLLYRYGVTPANPMGEEWGHVDTDHSLVDISLDAFCNLWAICHNGSAYFRMGIKEEEPRGTLWMHINKPDKDVNLVKISAGKYGVWALSCSGECYIRTKVSAAREYGQAWELVESEAMSSISVNSSDQVFGVTEKDKAIVSRDGVSGDNLGGSSWSPVLQDDWSDVCITATSQQHHWDQIDEMTLNAMARYRTRIWVKLRENRLKESDWLEYHRHCPSIFPGDRVLVKGVEETWYKTIIDHVGKDSHLKIRNNGMFSTSYDTVTPKDMVRDECPHRTHLAPGSAVLAKLSIFSNKFSECKVKECLFGKDKVVLEEGNKVFNITDIRIPSITLESDIYFLDRKRSHSFFSDEHDREINI